MVLGKLFRIYHKTDKNNVYSVLLENKNDRSETLLFESGAIGVLSSHETESVKPLYHILTDVYGCLGVLNISLGDGQNYLYLVCVLSCVSIGKIQNYEVFCITETTFVPLHGHQSDLDRIQDVRKILNSQTFYFSWSPANAEPQTHKFDLTLCCQRSERTTNTDNRFFWNRMLYLHLKSFDVDTDRWLLKTMCGNVCINTVYVGHQKAKACLISRLSCERAGTRFNVRGTNDFGHVANFVETEQVIFVDNNRISSYILIRGSIPLFWEQTGVQVGTHRLKVSRGSEISHPAFERHLAMIKYLYGKQVIINLVGHKEGEHLIGSMYKAHHKSSRFRDDTAYIAFDYHQYCARGREENLVLILKEKIKKYFDDFGFYYSLNDKDKNYQTGTFRVNCIDCLDRTNRVQTFLGLEILKKQLNILNLDEKSTIISRFFEVYKNMWQTNGDQISRIYAGTGALEGKSKFRDGTLSVARTIQNNLLDNSKQEAFDILLTGKPLVSDYSEKFRSLLPTKYLHLPSKILLSTCDRHFEYTSIYEVKVALGTWNVNGGKHFNSIIYKKSDPLSDWLLDANKKNTNANQVNILDLSLDDSLSSLKTDSPDLFAIGFEEIVDLSAQNIVATSTTSQKEWLVELEKTLSRNESYVLVTCIQLVGVCLFLFVKPKYARFIKDVSTDSVKTGLGGATGNKGGVGIRLRLYNSTLCFVCSHFAAGQHQVNERNSDFKEISRKMFNSIGKNLYSHDYVFWCGDFNYRIDMPIDDVKKLINEKNWEQLLESDQLTRQQREGNVFRNYLEGQINFAPTYKYDVNSEDYDTSEKSRIPAWTDRVLFRKFQPTRLAEKEANKLEYGEIIFYGRAELKTSDHRPVLAEFKVEILQVDQEKLSRVFHDVIEKAGPPDATVIIKEADTLENVKCFERIFVGELLKKINDEIGPIVLAQFGDDHMRISFKDGTTTLKLAKMGIIDILDKKFQVFLKTPNWVELIEEEVNYGVSNTIPMLENNVKYNIDDLNDYDIPKVISPDSPDDIEPIINTIAISSTPTRPLPPSKSNNEGRENNKKPARPAPPPPNKNSLNNKSSVDKILNGSMDDPLEINETKFNPIPPSLVNQPLLARPPPLVPPLPLIPNNVNHNFQTDEDEDEDEDMELSDYPVPSMPVPNRPPPNIPPPSAPVFPPNIPPAASLPPRIPSRRVPPTIPPRNNN